MFVAYWKLIGKSVPDSRTPATLRNTTKKTAQRLKKVRFGKRINLL